MYKIVCNVAALFVFSELVWIGWFISFQNIFKHISVYLGGGLLQYACMCEGGEIDQN